MKRISALTTLTLFSLLSACAGPNPNPGERSADVLWSRYKHQEALEIIRRNAEEGLPWAQLRLGVAYELGKGVEQNFAEALKWYKRAAVQQSEGLWADGILIGALGTPGYFNQNGDAMIAQYQIATIYLRGGSGVQKDLVEAYLWARYVLAKSAGKDLFYCCEFQGGRWIPQNKIVEAFDNIKSEMSNEQIQEAETLYENWAPEVD